MGMQDKFFAKVAQRESIRISVRSICFRDNYLLVEQPADDPHAGYSFIGGELEFGELMESALKREYQEETGLEPQILRYLFVVENRFQFNGNFIHSLEHYFYTEIKQTKIQSQESDLVQCWLPIKQLQNYDLCPHIVRDVVYDGTWKNAQRLIVPFSR